MRMSDGSSDVCSSDLELGACENLEQARRLLQRQKAKRIADEGRHAARLAAQAIEEQVEDQQPEKSLGFAAAGREIEEARRELVAEGVEAVGKFGHERRERRNKRGNEGELEIGRAKCRERRCQYV